VCGTSNVAIRVGVRHRLAGVAEIAGESDVVHVRTVDRR
jgi:hypothetical protein